ncbi:hypothetical protein ISI02_26490, partial [Burkholderia pseudomallei]|nr:hypothetical protein [Burkholderia pseudomallei]
RRPARSICNSAANRIRNPFKQCPGRQNEALFNSLLVNTVGVRIVPDWQQNFDHQSPTEKWLQCLKQRGKEGLFDLGRQPYQSFAKLISLRNTWMHHKPIDEEVKQAGRDGKTTIERNMGSRFISELPTQMRTLICDLFTAIGEEPPYWLNARPGWEV